MLMPPWVQQHYIHVPVFWRCEHPQAACRNTPCLVAQAFDVGQKSLN
jgi:hypothetical protein